MPPVFRNHLVPTACGTPAPTAASSLAMPAAIAAQNRRRSCRPATGGRPGDDNGGLSTPKRGDLQTIILSRLRRVDIVIGIFGLASLCGLPLAGARWAFGRSPQQVSRPRRHNVARWSPVKRYRPDLVTAFNVMRQRPLWGEPCGRRQLASAVSSRLSSTVIGASCGMSSHIIASLPLLKDVSLADRRPN